MLIDSKYFIERTKCPNCKSEQTKFYTKVFTPFYQSSTGIIELVDEIKRNRFLLKCSNCGLVFHHLLPKKELLGLLNERKDFFNKWAFNSSRNALGKRDLVKIYSPSKTLLDVGCFAGDFLSFFDKDYELWGIEPSFLAGSFAKSKCSAKIINQFLEDAKLPAEYFSAVTMFDVLEHLNDPELCLSKIYDSLKFNGILIVETGNYSSSIARLLRGTWWYFSLLEHLVFWNKDSLIRSLKILGFKTILCEQRVHHKESIQKTVFSYLLTFLFYAIIHLKVENFFLKICKKLGKLGTLPLVVCSDHILVLARKVK